MASTSDTTAVGFTAGFSSLAPLHKDIRRRSKQPDVSLLMTDSRDFVYSNKEHDCYSKITNCPKNSVKIEKLGRKNNYYFADRSF